MIGFAANDDPQRDERIIAARLGRHGDRPRHLQSTRHGHDLDAVARILDDGARALDQRVVQRVIIARLDDQYPRHQASRLLHGRSPPLSRPYHPTPTSVWCMLVVSTLSCLSLSVTNQQPTPQWRLPPTLRPPSTPGMKSLV